MLLGMAPVFAQSSPAAPTGAPAPKTPEEQLQDAVYRYQAVGAKSAILTLNDLASDPRVPREVRHEALIYIGEIYLFDEQVGKATDAFSEVIVADPTFQVDHFRHPPEVGVFFLELRQQLIPTLKPPAPPPTIAVPALYYEWGEWPTSERLLFGTETLFAAGATGLNVYLLINRTSFDDDEEDRARAAQLRATQLSFFGGYVGTHLWRTLRARRHHQQTWRADLLLGQASLDEPPLMLSVEARF